MDGGTRVIEVYCVARAYHYYYFCVIGKRSSRKEGERERLR